MKNINFSNLRCIVLTLVLSSFGNLTFAQWSNDPTINNPICNAPLDQFYPKIVSDGSGGALITWDDNRNTNTDANIYVQRINSSGYVQWVTDGLTVCDTIRNQSVPVIARDGSGGAIIAWNDQRDVSLVSDIFAQRIDAFGVAQWTKNGIPICNTPESQAGPVILSNGSGGAIIAWNDSRGMPNTNIFMQKIDSSGVTQWLTNGVALTDTTVEGGENHLTLVSDGAGGAIITYEDTRVNYSDPDIYVQKINASGVVQWTTNGVLISDAYSSVSPKSTSDGAGGAIITWMDLRNGSAYHIYAQRIDANGNVQWPANGAAICTIQYGGNLPAITSDDEGGAIIAWEDIREGALNFDIYAQKINASGIVQWTENGVAICQANNNQVQLTIIGDDSGGAIITWGDKRAGGSFGDIYAQKINASGLVQWANDGVAISTAVKDQNAPALVSDGSGGAIITWGDKRNDFSTAYDIYAQQVSSGGALGIVTGIEEPGSIIDIDLLQNYPNPFNPTTNIKYSIPTLRFVTIKVYDVLGNEVAVLVNEEKQIGNYELSWNAANLSSGVYFYQLRAGSYVEIKKMILIK